MLDKKTKGKVILQEVDTPIGEILLGTFENKLCLCDWKCNRHRERNDNRVKRLWGLEYETFNLDSVHNLQAESINTILRTKRELEEYFAGKRKTFDVPLLMTGTDFQKQVWQALMSIPFGSTVSYKDIACRIGNAKGVRAVAQAIGANPLSIIVPCHRVIGSNGSLTGYAGGVEAKHFLLQLEDGSRLC